jgi:hypothetical protein
MRKKRDMLFSMPYEEDKETLFSIQNEEQLDKLKKPKVSFYSSKKTIQSLLALKDVKEDIRPLLKKGRIVDIVEDRYGGYNLRVSSEDAEYLHGGGKINGIEMLENGLRELSHKKDFDIHNYDWTWVPPVVGAVGGFVSGGLFGHFSAVFANQTYSEVQQAAILTALKGAGIGTIGGALFDAGVIAKDMIEAYVATPLKRVRLSDKVQNAYGHKS